MLLTFRKSDPEMFSFSLSKTQSSEQKYRIYFDLNLKYEAVYLNFEEGEIRLYGQSEPNTVSKFQLYFVLL